MTWVPFSVIQVTELVEDETLFVMLRENYYNYTVLL